MKRYLGVWLLVCACLLTLVAAINLVVDPYGIFRLVDVAGFNSVKPDSGPHSATAKAYQVLRFAPRTLILGNSRAEVGFDPDAPVWPAADRPVYNLALPGTGPTTSLQYLQHVLAAVKEGRSPRIESVVWGIDFPDFLTDPDAPVPATSIKRTDARLASSSDGSPNPQRVLQQWRDYFGATFSLQVLIDSIQTLSSQKDRYAAGLTAAGFNPLANYTRIAADEGYWAIFNQKDIDNTRAYSRRPDAIYGLGGRSSADLEDLRQMLVVCRSNGISLRLVIYPYHAHLLEIIRVTGHWDAFETWKRAVVRIVAEEAEAAHGDPVVLWDFSGFNRYSTEAIPKKGDRESTTRWFWEAGHFKRELGNLVLARVLGDPNADADFGARLDAGNVEGRILSIRAEELQYRSGASTDVEYLERTARDRK